MIVAIMIDSREPAWVQGLTFGGIPTAVTLLDVGDIHALADDGKLIVIERKTPDDLLNTLREERLFPQATRMANMRIQDNNVWPYILITGNMTATISGQIATDHRETAWAFSSVMGALLSIQEMGVFVTQCASDSDFEAAVLRLGNRKREGAQYVLPPRPAHSLGHGAALIASLPGIGTEKALDVLKWAGNSPAIALAGLTDLSIAAPAGIGEITRRKIRQVLGLAERQQLEISPDDEGREMIQLFEQAFSEGR